LPATAPLLAVDTTEAALIVPVTVTLSNSGSA
jgi:hypothetical protein